MKSTDGGGTWQILATDTFQGQGFARLAVIPGAGKTPDVLYGATMQTTAGSSTSVDFHPQVTAGLYKSVNGGTNWTLLSGKGNLPSGGQISGSASDVVLEPGNPSTVFAAIVCRTDDECYNNGGVYRSTDSGVSWKQLAGVPTQTVRAALYIVPDGKEAPLLYAGFAAATGDDFNALYRSTDRGDTWAKGGALPVVGGSAGCNALGTNQADYNLALGGDPNDPSTIFLGLVGLYKSSDGGKSWKYVISDTQGLHGDFHTAVVNNGNVWVTNDGGVSLSTDGGTTWNASVNNGLNTLQFQGVAISKTGSVIIGGTQDNGSMVYNGTLAWQHATDGDGGITAVAQSDPSIVFTEFQFEQKEGLEHLSRSTKGGKIGTFNDITPVGAGKQPAQFFTPISLDPSNDDRLLYGTTLIWDTCGPTGKACNATSGNPLNWSDINPQSGASIKCDNCKLSDVRIAATDPGVMYAITDLGTIGAKTGPQAFVSTDSNTANPTFSDISSGLGTAFGLTSVAISPVDAAVVAVTETGFAPAGQDGGHVFWSQNSGRTWIDISKAASGFPNLPALKVIFDQTDVTGKTLLVGTSAGIVRTTNAGTSWSDFNLKSLPPVQVFFLAQQTGTGAVLAATHGRGVWMLAAESPTPTATPEPSATSTPGTGASVTGSSTRTFGGPGQTISGGTLTLQNTSGSAESVAQVSVQESSPALFSALTLSARVGGGPTQTQTGKPGSTTVFSFSPALLVPAGGTATFNLSVTTAVATANARGGAAYASLVVDVFGRAWNGNGTR